MPKKSEELEKIILDDGWILVRQTGSHRQYKHPVKPGLVTIPFHSKELSKYVERSVLKQANIMEEKKK